MKESHYCNRIYKKVYRNSKNGLTKELSMIYTCSENGTDRR